MAGRGQRQKDQPRPMFTVNKVPGFAAQMHRDSIGKAIGYPPLNTKRSDGSPNGNSVENGLRSRDSSPKIPRPRSEEIPLEDMCIRKTSLASNGSLRLLDRKDSSISGSSVNSEVSLISRKYSEETSFTSTQNHEYKPRKRGQVETV